MLPARTEFDYLPTPVLASIDFGPGVAPLASEGFGTIVTLHGRGFGILGTEWVDVGTPGQESSQDPIILGETSTTITVALLPTRPTLRELRRPVSVQTLASPNVADYRSNEFPSNRLTGAFAATRVLTSWSSRTRYSSGPSTGGTPLRIVGKGLVNAWYVQFTDRMGPSFGVDFNLRRTLLPGVITTVTPPEAPGIDTLAICSVSGCSNQIFCNSPTSCPAPPPSATETFTFFPPGRPHVSSVSPARGAVGSKVTITGTNLGLAEQVWFGPVEAKRFINSPQLLDTGSTTTVTVRVPEGLRLGAAVPVRVVTAESLALQAYPKSPVNPRATFTRVRAPAKGHG